MNPIKLQNVLFKKNNLLLQIGNRVLKSYKTGLYETKN